MIKELISIQYLRGIAALLVVVEHLSITRGIEYLSLPSLGDFGVHVFFVISGFIMWYTTAESDISTLDFWRRRLIRVVPLYWLFLSLMVAIGLSTPELLYATAITPETTLKSFLFIPHFHAVQNIVAPILIPGWSLNFEMFFYLLFGLVLSIQSRTHRAALLCGLLFALVCLGFIFRPTGAVASTYTNATLLTFVEGIALAIVYPRIKGTAVGFALLTAAALLWLSPGDLFELFAPWLVVAGVLAFEPTMRRGPIHLFHLIGDASYSIYLSHLFFLRISEIGWTRFAPFKSSVALDGVYASLALTFAIAGGIAVFCLVERPILILLRGRRVPISPKHGGNFN